MSERLLTKVNGWGNLPRYSIISIIGEKYYQQNIENGEFSYQQVIDRHLTGHFKLDLRFYDKSSEVAVLVETKNKKFRKSDIEQLFDYVKLEQEVSEKTKIIAILAGTHNGSIRVWKFINGYEIELNDTQIKSMAEYASYFVRRNINDKTKVLDNTKELNKKLHNNGIKEHLRSQFVGTCLLALNPTFSHLTFFKKIGADYQPFMFRFWPKPQCRTQRSETLCLPLRHELHLSDTIQPRDRRV